MDFSSRYLKNKLVVTSILFIIALIIRVEFVRLNMSHVYIGRDAKQYVDYAHNIVNHGVFSNSTSQSNPKPDSFRSPGYPIFIAVIRWLAGEQSYLTLLLYTHAALSALLAPLTFLAGTFFLPFYGALFAALMVVFSPHLITIAGCMLTETIFSFFLLTSICCFQYTLKKKYLELFVVSALLFGYTYMINEASLLLPYLIFILMAIKKYLTKSHILKKMIIFLVIFSVVPIGWSLRNFLNVPPESKKGSDRAIVTMSHGAYPGFIYKNPRYKRFPYREDPMQPEFGESFKNFKHIMWTRVKKEPGRYAKWYLFGKPYYLWSWNILQGVGDVFVYPVKYNIFKMSKFIGSIKLIVKRLHYILTLLALAGVPILYRRYQKKITMDEFLRTPFLHFAVCIYFTVLYSVFAPWPRYSIPLRPELYLFSVWSLISLIKFFNDRRGIMLGSSNQPSKRFLNSAG